MAYPFDPILDLNFMRNAYVGSNGNLTVTGANSRLFTFSRTGSAWYFDKDGVLQVKTANVPRLDWDPTTLQLRGLLLEETRTNSVRNNSMTGAVVGTPGTAPTNWALQGLGLTTSIVAFGTDNGLPYIDIRFSGTTSSSGQLAAQMDLSNIASAAQVWTASIYLKLVAGSWTNVTQMGVQINVIGGTGSARGDATPTGALLSSQRVTVAATLGAGASAVFPYFVGLVSNGVAVDFTLRIGAPQLELGSCVTSPILTTAAAVSRGGDILSIPPINTQACTLYAEAEFDAPSTYTANQFAVSLDDGSVNNRSILYRGTTGFGTGAIARGGVTIFTVGSSAVAAGGIMKGALSHIVAGTKLATSGNVFSTNGTLGADTTHTGLRLGSNSSGTAQLNGYLKRVIAWKRVLSDAQMQMLVR